MFSHAGHLFVVSSLGHLILLIIYKLFKLYTEAAGSYKSPGEAHRPSVYGILSFKPCVNRDQVPSFYVVVVESTSQRT